MNEYRNRLEGILGPDKQVVRAMRHDISNVRAQGGGVPQIVVPHGNDRRILKAAAQIADGGDVRLCLLGNKDEITAHAQSLGIREINRVVDIVDPQEDDSRFDAYVERLFALRQRRGVSLPGARQLMRNHNYFACMMAQTGEADGLLAGLIEPYARAAKPIMEIIGAEPGRIMAGIYMVMVRDRICFFADCTINIDPDAETLADIALSAAEVARRYGKEKPRVALLSFASFGASRHPRAEKVARAAEIAKKRAPDLEVDGEMQADVALNVEMREHEFPFSLLKGPANVLVFPDLGSAHIACKLLANLAGATLIGPLMAGTSKPANILQRSATSEEIVSLIYLTAHQCVPGRY